MSIGRTNSGGGGGSINTITVDFYSAVADTVTYLGVVDGLTHTITTDGNGHATAEIAIARRLPTTFTFISSVAKNPDSLSDYYSKVITLTDETTSVYCMPDDFLYWYGTFNTRYGAGDLKNLGYAGNIEGYGSKSMTYNTNSASINSKDATWAGIGSNIPIDLSVFNSLNSICKKDENAESGKFSGTFTNASKTVIRDMYYNFSGTRKTSQNISSITNERYVGIQTNWDKKLTVYALWLE